MQQQWLTALSDKADKSVHLPETIQQLPWQIKNSLIIWFQRLCWNSLNIWFYISQWLLPALVLFNGKDKVHILKFLSMSDCLELDQMMAGLMLMRCLLSMWWEMYRILQNYNGVTNANIILFWQATLASLTTPWEMDVGCSTAQCR